MVRLLSLHKPTLRLCFPFFFFVAFIRGFMLLSLSYSSFRWLPAHVCLISLTFSSFAAAISTPISHSLRTALFLCSLYVWSYGYLLLSRTLDLPAGLKEVIGFSSLSRISNCVNAFDFAVLLRWELFPQNVLHSILLFDVMQNQAIESHFLHLYSEAYERRGVESSVPMYPHCLSARADPYH